MRRYSKPLFQVITTASQIETEEGVESVATVTVTSDFSVYCQASNGYGNDSLTFNIKTSEWLRSLCLWTSLAVVPPPRSFWFLSLLDLFLLLELAACEAVLPGILDTLICVAVVVSDETLQSCVSGKSSPLLPPVY